MGFTQDLIQRLKNKYPSMASDVPCIKISASSQHYCRDLKICMPSVSHFSRGEAMTVWLTLGVEPLIPCFRFFKISIESSKLQATP
jgi:hypothetical protein